MVHRGQARQRQGDGKKRVEGRGQGHRAHESGKARQGRAPVPGGEAPVWLRERVHQRTDQEQGARTDTVRPGQPANGATNLAGSRRGDSPVWQKMGLIRVTSWHGSRKTPKYHV